MSRPTADLVADLRAACYYRCVEHSMVGRCRNCMAADRLAELDAENEALRELRDVDVSILAAVRRIDALRPPCPTCGGKGVIVTPDSVGAAFFAVMDKGKGAGIPHLACSDCVDGKASIEQLAATWRAVHLLVEYPAAPADDPANKIIRYLQSVKP